MKKIIKICGDTFHIKDGKLHKDKGPAIKFKSGIEWWMQNGKLHRENGPAIVGKKEILEYWLNGVPAEDNEIINIKRNKWIDKSYEDRRKEIK